MAEVTEVEDLNQGYEEDTAKELDAQKFMERAGAIDFTNPEENQFMEEYAKKIISKFPQIGRDEAAALLMYITRNEANRQGILENIMIKISNETKVGRTRVKGIGAKGPISEIVFSEQELIEGVNNGNMEAYVTGIGHLVESACHEVEHAKQNTRMYSQEPQLDYETLRMAKESIINRVDTEFYTKNYRSYIMERNAFLNGRLQEKSALENLRGVLGEELYSRIEKRINELIEFDRTAEITTMKTKESGYSQKDNAEMVLTDVTDTIMPMYATDALKTYPILSYQYREDGTKKDLSELFLERDTKIQQLQEELPTATSSRKIEIEKEIEGITVFYDEMIQGDRQLLAQKEEFDRQTEESRGQDISEPQMGESQYRYTDTIEKIEKNSEWLYEYNREKNCIEWSIEGREDFIGKTMGEEYSKLFEDSDKKQLAELFGKLDFKALNDTRLNYDERGSGRTQQKYLVGLQKLESENGNIFVAQYEVSMEEGKPFNMVYEYYTLDEKGNLVLMEGEPEFGKGESIVAQITQSEIAENLDRRKDIVEDMDRRLSDEVKEYQEKTPEEVEEPEQSSIEQVVEDREPEPAPSSFGQVSKGREEVTQVSFEQALLKSGFSIDSVEDIKKSITGVHPRKLVSMDRILTREEKKLKLEREGIEESGSEQSYG